MSSSDFSLKFVTLVEQLVSAGCTNDQITTVLRAHGVTISLDGNKITITEGEWSKLERAGDDVLRSLESVAPRRNERTPTDTLNRGTDTNSIYEIRAAAERGDVTAQFSLGSFYGKPDCETTNHTEAVKWYRLAAQNGHPEAHGKLGFRYSVGGYGTPKNLAEAIRYYTRGVELGDAYCQHNLAVLYVDGEGVTKDLPKGLRLLRMAANQGFSHSLRCLANMYHSGEGVRVNHAEAFRLWQRAAEGGDAESQFNLGLCLRDGIGSNRDPVEAAKWIRRANAQGFWPESEDSEKLVSLRDADGRGKGEMMLRELHAGMANGTIAWSTQMRWSDGGPWVVLEDIMLSEDDEQRAETLLRQRSAHKILAQAVSQGDYELLKWVLAVEPDILEQPNDFLVQAIKGGHPLCVRLLVSRRPSLIDAQVLDAAFESDNSTINRYLNPTEDVEFGRLLQSACEDTRKMQSNAVRLDSIRSQVAKLEKQLVTLPKNGNDGIHVPKCPTCGSPDVARIALASKGIAALTFGLFSVGYLGKTYECNNCRYKW